MQKLLLLLVPLLLLVGCETSAEPQSGIVVGAIRECKTTVIGSGMTETLAFIGSECEVWTDQSSDEFSLLINYDFWEITVLTPQGESYVIKLDVKDSAEFLPVAIGDPWPPSE